MRIAIPVLLAAALTIPVPPARADDPGAPTDPACAILFERIARGGPIAGERLISREAMRLFYAGRGCRLAWSRGGAPLPQASEVLEAVRAADREGLNPADYHAETAAVLLGAARAVQPGGGHDPVVAEDLDLLLTDAFLLYADHLTNGRVDPESVEPAWNIPGRARDLGFLLATALENSHLAATLRGLPPDREDYRILRDALASCRAAAASGGWPMVPWGPALREGDRGPRVAALRRRLAATGDAPGGGDGGDLLDAPLAEALRRFQRRHGLDVDAVAGRRTLSELNTPATLRARQIAANLERVRWLPRELGRRRITVNVAGFSLEYAENGAPALSMRVIAGRQARRTPFFTGEITSIVLNPAWTVPEKIAVEDKLPLILEDPGYLRDEGFRVLRPDGGRWREVDPAEVDWRSLGPGRFPYRLRQDPGPRNALGRIKFQVPNRHDIYLHDTPSRGLFARAERTFSSGCIRLERPLELAERLLGPDWPAPRITAVIDAGATVTVPLPEAVRVYLLYWTAWVDRDGVMQFREDVYGSDEALEAALRRAPAPDGDGGGRP